MFDIRTKLSSGDQSFDQLAKQAVGAMAPWPDFKGTRHLIHRFESKFSWHKRAS